MNPKEKYKYGVYNKNKELIAEFDTRKEAEECVLDLQFKQELGNHKILIVEKK